MIRSLALLLSIAQSASAATRSEIPKMFESIPPQLWSPAITFLNGPTADNYTLYYTLCDVTHGKPLEDAEIQDKFAEFFGKIQSDDTTAPQMLAIAKRLDDLKDTLIRFVPQEQRDSFAASAERAREETLLIAKRKMDDLMQPIARSLSAEKDDGTTPDVAAPNALVPFAQPPIGIVGHTTIFSQRTGQKEFVWIRDILIGGYKTEDELKSDQFGAFFYGLHGVDFEEVSARQAADQKRRFNGGKQREYDLLRDLRVGKPIGKIRISEPRTPKRGEHWSLYKYYLPVRGPRGKWSYPPVHYYGDNQDPKIRRWTIIEVFKEPNGVDQNNLTPEEIDAFIQLVRIGVKDNFMLGYGGRMEVDVHGSDPKTRFRALSLMGFVKAKKCFRGGSEAWYIPPENVERFRAMVAEDPVLEPTITGSASRFNLRPISRLQKAEKN